MTRPGSLGAWWLAVRPATLAAAFVPVAVGTGLVAATANVRWGAALAALGGAFALQIGTNFANDVFDYEKGADTEERVGPVRTAQAGLLSTRALYIGMVVAFAIATLFGLYLTYVSGPIIIAVGVASILSGIAYTGGPFPLAYNGLGDVFVMVFFGFVAVCGTAFVQVGHVPTLAWIASVPVGAMATNILVVNNVRDRFTDPKVGKRTLAVRFGKTGGLIEYALLLALAYAAPLALGVLLRSPLLLLPLVTLPLGIRLFRELRHGEGSTLNATLAGTAKLMTLHGIVFAASLALAPALVIN
ncbi:MAG: 1,4-dihydroxy-2-naphthoate polyprenyltransferase [Myxococcota bacterium]